MNYKETLRNETNYLRGLNYLDAKLKKEWISRNLNILGRAKGMMDNNEFKIFANDLYKAQLWRNLDAANINKGAYGKNFKPNKQFVDNYFKKITSDIDFTLKYAPDLDKNNQYVGPDKNTGWSPEMWGMYNNLKDDKAKQEFRSQIKTEKEIRSEALAETRTNAKLEARSLQYANSNSNMGVATENIANFIASKITGDNTYLNQGVTINRPGKAELASNNSLNKKKADAIWSRSLERYRNTKEFKEAVNREFSTFKKYFQNNIKQYGNKKGESINFKYYNDAVKESPVLSAAFGYDAKSGKFNHSAFASARCLLEDEPEFMPKYLATREVLRKQVEEGKISNADYQKALDDFATNKLKDHEPWIARARNAIKGAFNTGITYTLHKFAPYVNMAELAAKGTDGKVFMDTYGRVYKDSEVTLNAHFNNKKSPDSAILYRTSDGNVINYNKDGYKMFYIGDKKYVYQDDKGRILPVSESQLRAIYNGKQDPHIKEVKSIAVKNTKIDKLDLMALGKDDKGNDLNWAGGIFNQRYLELSDRYNTSVWAKKDLDFFDQYGYSNYTNIQRPGDTSGDFFGEVTKMFGFIAADIIATVAMRGIGKAVGMGSRGLNYVGALSGMMGASAIADSYASGVFNENIQNSQQLFEDVIQKRAQEKARLWASSKEGQAQIKEKYNQTLNKINENGRNSIPASELQRIESEIVNTVISEKMQDFYDQEIADPKNAALQERLVRTAGNAAMVDFYGEALKYGIVNMSGFRSWMFKSRNAAENAIRASEKTLFGKHLSRVGEATAADVKNGLAKKEGELILKKAWSDMSKKQKALTVSGVVAKQFWGGAWTNFTDEMQSAGAKEQNNLLFSSILNDNDPSTLNQVVGGITSQVWGALKNTLEPNTWWAGLIGGSGAVGLLPNIAGTAGLVTKQGRETFRNSSTLGKWDTFVSNSILNNVYQKSMNDKQAQIILRSANRLTGNVRDNIKNIVGTLYNSSRIGHSENAAENEEIDLLSLFHTLEAIRQFSKSNPGLAELDATKVLKDFTSKVEKLKDISKMSESERNEVIEQIKVSNPSMTEEQAVQELEKVQKRAAMMQDVMAKWQELINSEEYRKAESKDGSESKAQRRMETRFTARLLNDYALESMREREEKISGSSTITGLDTHASEESTTDISSETDSKSTESSSTPSTAEVSGKSISTKQSKAKSRLLHTFGTSKEALKRVTNSFNIAIEKVLDRKQRLEKARENLKYEEKLADLTNKLTEAETEEEKKAIQEEIHSLEQDYDYFSYAISKMDSNLTELTRQRDDFKKLSEDKNIDMAVITAEEILKLDPIARMRMLDKNNKNNYNDKQQAEIEKANKILSGNNATFQDVVDQAYAYSRFSQREDLITDLVNGKEVEASYTARVGSMIEAANKMKMADMAKDVRNFIKEVNDSNLSEDAKIQYKLLQYKKFSPYALKYLYDKVGAEEKALIDQVMPIVETGEQLIDMVYNENYGLTDLSTEERKNITDLIREKLEESSTVEEFIDNLAQNTTSNNNPSINTLLDKLGKVYAQEHATIVESAKEKAERKEKERKEKEKRDVAAKEALEKTETATPVTSAGEGEGTKTGLKESTSKEEGNKGKNEGESKTQEELMQEAKNKIFESQKLVQDPSERDHNADYYLIAGRKYMRVHGSMGGTWIGPVSTRNNSGRALKNGSAVDAIVRDFFNGITPVKPENFSDEAFGALITSLEAIRDRIQANGEEFLANNIVLYHEFPNGIRIAGEVDILSVKIVNGKPQYSIYDLKTSAGDSRTGNAFTESSYWNTDPASGARYTIMGTGEQYQTQVSMYKLLFEKMFNIPIVNIGLIPYKLSYDSNDNVVSITKHEDIPLSYTSNVEKIIAYQPAVEKTLQAIQHLSAGLFTKDQLNTIKGIILNGIVKGQSFGRDFGFFIQNQGLQQLYENSNLAKEMNMIIKELVETTSNIDVSEALKEEFKDPPTPPTPPTPADVAEEKGPNNDYDPDRESYDPPEAGSDVNQLGPDSNSIPIQQPGTPAGNVVDLGTGTATETLDSESTDGEEASTIKGNSMSPYVYEDRTPDVEEEDREDAQRGILAKKAFGSKMQAFNNWLEAKGINLQGLIDDKLSDILSVGTKDAPVKIRFLRVNPKMTSRGGQLMDGHYMLVVEDSPALRKVYTDKDVKKYGDFIESNGKKYLIIGTAGFSTPLQGNAYRKIMTKGSNSVKAKADRYFNDNPNEEFFVDQDKYTHVAKIHSGFIIRRLEGEAVPKIRKLSELMADEDRNPSGLTWEDLVFGYQLSREFRLVPAQDDITAFRAPLRGNLGGIFVYIKGVDGNYYPVAITPTRYSEISQGALKSKIDQAIRKLSSLNHHDRYKGLLELFNLVVLRDDSHPLTTVDLNILIGTKDVPTVSFIKGGDILQTIDLRRAGYQEVLAAFTNFNPRIKIGANNLVSTQSLKELDEAGALRTNAARLGKAAGDYSIYNIDNNGEPVIPELTSASNNTPNTERGGIRHIRIGDSYYSKQGDSYYNENGTEVTDQKTINDIKLNEYILNNNIPEVAVMGGKIYYDLGEAGIVSVDNGKHAEQVVSSEELSKVKDIINKRKEAAEEERRNSAAEEVIAEEKNSQEEEHSEENPEVLPENSDPTVSVTELLNLDVPQTEDQHQSTPPSTPAVENNTHNINTNERKALEDSSNTGNGDNFAGETSALDILTSDGPLAEEAMDTIIEKYPEAEDMSIKQIVELLRNKGKTASSISDVRAWIDTLKC